MFQVRGDQAHNLSQYDFFVHSDRLLVVLERTPTLLVQRLGIIKDGRLSYLPGITRDQSPLIFSLDLDAMVGIVEPSQLGALV